MKNIKKLIKFYLIIFITLSFTSLSSCSNCHKNSCFRVNNNTPAFALLAIKDGKVIFKDVHGCARFDNKTKKCTLKATKDTRFLINSMSKHFTVAGILMLEEEGKLSINDNITKYLDLPKKFNNIKIRHLIYHTSGISSNIISKTFNTDKQNELYTQGQTLGNDEYFELIKNTNIHLEKYGIKYKYSNSGYILLAKIIEEVSKQKYEDFVQERIFNRFQMNTAFLNASKDKQDNYVYGYSCWPLFVEQKGEFIDRNMGAGGMWMTLEDYIKWIDAFDNNKIFKRKETMEKFLSKGKYDNGKKIMIKKDNNINYGFGMVHKKEKFNGKEYNILEHKGGFAGTSSQFIKIIEPNTWIVYFNNSYDIV